MARIPSQTIIELIDQSYIKDDVQENTGAPLFLVGLTSDKGPEDLTKITSYQQFVKLYGEPSYAKHGQVSIQTASMLKAGAACLIKRAVAQDATLGNLIVTAKVRKLKGADLGDGNYEPIPEGQPKFDITYNVATVENAKTQSDVYVGAANLYKSEEDGDLITYPLFGVYDLGRCDSNKKIRIVPDYKISKDIGFMQYNMYIEDGSAVKCATFSLDQTMMYSNVCYGLASVCKKSDLISADIYPQFDEFKKLMMEGLGITEDEFFFTDILFGCDKLGKPNPNLTINEDSVNLSTALGLAIKSGSNGSYGEFPKNAETYDDDITAIFDGRATDDIYDVTRYQLAGVIDANYPASAKRAIEQLMTWRLDGFFFADLGSVKTLEQIKAVHNQALLNKFSASYYLTYDVMDPYSLKPVFVTSTYSLAPLIVNHFINGCARPFNGSIYDVIIKDAIPGTLNFIPKTIPSVDQKQELVDTQVNYASYYGDDLVLESQWTRQPEHTQFSYIHNVLAVQRVIKDLRLNCPKTRYTFLNGEDFDSYKQDVERRLDLYKSDFKSLTFEYIEDDLAIQNKKFMAAIKVVCRNYVHAEHFKFYILG